MIGKKIMVCSRMIEIKKLVDNLMGCNIGVRHLFMAYKN
jgi:hypothetical protein